MIPLIEISRKFKLISNERQEMSRDLGMGGGEEQEGQIIKGASGNFVGRGECEIHCADHILT